MNRQASGMFGPAFLRRPVCPPRGVGSAANPEASDTSNIGLRGVSQARAVHAPAACKQVAHAVGMFDRCELLARWLMDASESWTTATTASKQLTLDSLSWAWCPYGHIRHFGSAGFFTSMPRLGLHCLPAKALSFSQLID
jgi:hypothetical protein